MKTKIKQLVKTIIRAVVNISRKTQAGQYLERNIVSSAMEQVTEISYENTTLKFAVPNPLCIWRAKTFATKEPETLRWIKSIPEGAVLWDIGANIGLYSVYAAKKRNCRVWAFEPSVFNMELLARNIFLNGLTDQICIIPLALSDRLGTNHLRMTSKEWGGALSTFGHEFGWDGQTIRQIFEFQTLGLSMEDAMQRLSIPQPDYIKMDVDGIEHLILKGGTEVLQSVKSILIEINDEFHEQSSQCQLLLTKAGLVLNEKCQSEMIAASASGFQNAYNQIWVRH